MSSSMARLGSRRGCMSAERLKVGRERCAFGLEERQQREEPPEQRRTLAVLLSAQILSGLGLAAGITVGALLAEQMLGSSRLSGLPTVFFTIGSPRGGRWPISQRRAVGQG